jgi:dehydrogenase/reductase SDR family protein 7B
MIDDDNGTVEASEHSMTESSKPTSSKLFVWVLLPIVATLVWHVLDANPSLWIYDWVTVGTGTPTTFHNQTIWVTGASSGIGAELVCQFAQAQAGHVILSARRVDRMEQVVNKCQSVATTTTTTFSIVPYDALDVEATKRTVQEAIDSCPTKSIDMLVLNSGTYQIQPALDTAPEERRRILRVNLEAPMELSQELIQQNQWKTRGHGHLVVISSVMAKGGLSLASTYAASKAALRTYFQCLSAEEFAWLRVNVVLPGATKTELWGQLEQDVHPDPGTLMTPERVAHLILKAVSGPYVLFYEVWIAKAAGLLYALMSHYTPTMFYFSNHLVALARQSAFEQGQMDMLEMPALIQTLMKLVLGR